MDDIDTTELPIELVRELSAKYQKRDIRTRIIPDDLSKVLSGEISASKLARMRGCSKQNIHVLCRTIDPNWSGVKAKRAYKSNPKS